MQTHSPVPTDQEETLTNKLVEQLPSLTTSQTDILILPAKLFRAVGKAFKACDIEFTSPFYLTASIDNAQAKQFFIKRWIPTRYQAQQVIWFDNPRLTTIGPVVAIRAKVNMKELSNRIKQELNQLPEFKQAYPWLNQIFDEDAIREDGEAYACRRFQETIQNAPK